MTQSLRWLTSLNFHRSANCSLLGIDKSKTKGGDEVYSKTWTKENRKCIDFYKPKGQTILWKIFRNLDNPRTFDIWDTVYNSDIWEPEFMTIFVVWQLIVTLDSIRNSCDVLLLGELFFPTWKVVLGAYSDRFRKTSQELRMLSSVTINCQITKIVMNSGSQLSEL